MKTLFKIKIVLMDGNVISFKEGSVAHFEFMTQGVFFVEGVVNITRGQGLRTLNTVKYENYRNWIPVVNIKNVEILTTKTIDEAEEIKKYEKFLEHGIDIMVTEISHTEKPTVAEVEKKIKAEKKQKRSIN